VPHLCAGEGVESPRCADGDAVIRRMFALMTLLAMVVPVLFWTRK
jgi:hypothetical protein